MGVASSLQVKTTGESPLAVIAAEFSMAGRTAKGQSARVLRETAKMPNCYDKQAILFGACFFYGLYQVALPSKQAWIPNCLL